jgi:putative FmdB family regulatory protein
MPTYEYECSKGHQFEVEQSINDAPLQRCKICRSKVHRLISASHFILKGGGWYADGYGSKKSGGDAKSGESKSEAKSDSKSESKSDSKSESKPEPKKSDAKSESKPKKGGSGSAAAAS